MKPVSMMLIAGVVLGGVSVYGYIHYSRLPSERVDLLTMQAAQGLRTSHMQVQAAAYAGNARAMRAEGLYYLTRKDAASIKKGIALLSAAAKKGEHEAALDLGRLSFYGRPGARPDYEQARVWLTPMADKLPAAAYYLALMDKNGLAGSIDLGKASEELIIASNGGIPDALFLLGSAYKSGNGIAKNDAEAIRCFQEAAVHEHAGAMLALALAYEHGEMGLPRDEYQANQLFALAHDAAQDPPRLP
jgi:TPR repeat protein